MADSPITGLPELFITSLTDVLVIDDLDTSITKKIEIQNLMLYPGPIGAGAANTGEFTTLQLPSGATINEFSIDGTLGGNSDLALPTEKAVKTYVDAQIATTDEHNELLGLQGGDSTSEQYYHLTLSQHNGLTDGGITFLHTHSVGSFPHNSLGSLQGGDSTASEFYHLTQTIHDQLFSASPLIGLGDPASTNIKVFNDPGGFTPYITMTLDGAFYSGPVLDAKVDRMEMGDISTASMTISWLNDNIVFTSTAIQRLGINQFGITLQNGGPIDEFSIDGTLAGNSDAAVPTEKAVKTYVDAQIATTDEHNELIGLQGGDSTADEFYHLTQSIHDGLFSASPIIGLGDITDTNLQVDYGSKSISMEITNLQRFTVDANYQRLGNIASGHYFESVTGGGEVSPALNLVGSGNIGLTTDGTTVEIPQGDLRVGDTSPSVAGEARMFGGTTGDIVGGMVTLYVADDYTSTSTWFRIKAERDHFIIGTNNTDLEALKYDAAARTWEMNLQAVTPLHISSTGMQLTSGARVNEFSIDGTLAGNSDAAVPTEKAVKTYVDAQIATTDEHNELIGLQGGDSTSEFYHLTQSIHDGLFSASPIIGLGDVSGTNFQVDYSPGGGITATLGGVFEVNNGSDNLTFDAPNRNFELDFDGYCGLRIERNLGVSDDVIRLYLNENSVLYARGNDTDNFISVGILAPTDPGSTTNGQWVRFNQKNYTTEFYNQDPAGSGATSLLLTEFGIKLEIGQTVNEISDDATLTGDSTSVLLTEHAVKTYVDAQIASGVITGQEALINGDSTGTVVFSSPESDTNYSLSCTLVNTTDGAPSIYAFIVSDKTVNGFEVIFSGTLDSANYILDWAILR